MEIGKKGVLALLCESSYSKNSGYTSPKHKLTDKLDHIFEDSEGRIIITSYAQNIFRTKEIVELTKKYGRKIVFYGRDKYDSTNSIVRIGQQLKKAVIEIPKEIIAFSTDIGKKNVDDNLVVLLSGTPQRIYHDILDIIDGGDESLKLNENDTFIVASPVIPGTEKIANKAINELYKTDANIHVLKNKELCSMHASQEDIKVIIQIFKPKYFIPIKGEYQHFISNLDIARSMEIAFENVGIIDNGEILTFIDGKLQDYRDTIEVEDVMIDGIGVGDVGDKVIDDRIQLSNDGVVVIGVTIDSQSRDIIANTDVQTRGFVYLRDSEYIIKGRCFHLPIIYTLGKPCSVHLAVWQPFISAVAAIIRFISLQTVPLPDFGFLACGVYRVPPAMFPKQLRHCDTLGPSTMDFSLGFSTAVTLAGAWPY